MDKLIIKYYIKLTVYKLTKYCGRLVGYNRWSEKDEYILSICLSEFYINMYDSLKYNYRLSSYNFYPYNYDIELYLSINSLSLHLSYKSSNKKSTLYNIHLTKYNMCYNDICKMYKSYDELKLNNINTI